MRGIGDGGARGELSPMTTAKRVTRRDVLRLGVAAGVASCLPPGLAAAGEQAGGAPNAGPIAIASGNGARAVAQAVELMSQGKDVVEAAVEGVVLVEEDPEDMSVGYGGLPNEAGVVELDACVMHGPTMRAGAVGALQNIKTPSRVAKAVMERTDHVFLVGGGALAFARAMGFEETDLLTDRARQAWLRWKAGLSKEDDWLSDEERRADFGVSGPEGSVPDRRPTGTISCLCLNARGELGGCTSTSGLAFKIPGRVGDSPIIGAGLYVDGAVGAAGSTGRGEANIQVCGSRTIVEDMRRGMSPRDAVLDVLQRICDQTRSPRLLHRPGRPNFNVTYYALRKDGRFAAGSIYKSGTFAANVKGVGSRPEPVYLFESADA